MWSGRLISVFANQGRTEHFEKLVRTAYRELSHDDFEICLHTVEAQDSEVGEAVIDILIDDLAEFEPTRVQEFAVLGLVAITFLSVDGIATGFELNRWNSKLIAGAACLGVIYASLRILIWARHKRVVSLIDAIGSAEGDI